MLLCCRNLAFTCLSDANLEAPPSFTPPKKYSDISGLPVSEAYVHIICGYELHCKCLITCALHWKIALYA